MIIVVNHLKLSTNAAGYDGMGKLSFVTVKSLKKKTEIAIVGKYVALHDAYLSIVEALMPCWHR